MKIFRDGDHVAVVKDDFINLLESPAVFFPEDSEIGITLLKDGVIGLPLGTLRSIVNELNSQQ